MHSFLAPAKINLWLRVLRRREDGFHEIETRMCPIDLHDEVSVERKPEPAIALTCSDPEIPTDSGNLAWKAAESFLKATGIDGGANIHLEKTIPSGAGLAGGSSDAATVLLALDEIYGTGLGVAGLTPLAAEIGSDVVFFLHRSACDCSGRGEKVVPAEFGEDLRLLLLKPSFGISTPWAYQQWRDSKELPGIPYGPQSLPWGEMVNDLERPVFAKHLLLAETKTWLLAQPGVRAALLSGSGSTMFAVLGEEADAEGLAATAQERYGEGCWVRLTRTKTGGGDE